MFFSLEMKKPLEELTELVIVLHCLEKHDFVGDMAVCLLGESQKKKSQHCHLAMPQGLIQVARLHHEAELVSHLQHHPLALHVGESPE